MRFKSKIAPPTGSDLARAARGEPCRHLIYGGRLWRLDPALVTLSSCWTYHRGGHQHHPHTRSLPECHHSDHRRPVIRHNHWRGVKRRNSADCVIPTPHSLYTTQLWASKLKQKSSNCTSSTLSTSAPLKIAGRAGERERRGTILVGSETETRTSGTTWRNGIYKISYNWSTTTIWCCPKPFTRWQFLWHRMTPMAWEAAREKQESSF